MTANPQMIWIAVAVVLLAVLAISGSMPLRSGKLRERFGSEYDSALETAGSLSASEDELILRNEEVERFKIRPLLAGERARYRKDWASVERRFVDRPTAAVVEADELVSDVMRTRGYPMGDFERHAAHLSVDHPRVVKHYRAGHAVIEGQRLATTEELRQAMLHYRVLFDQLVEAGADIERAVPVTHEVPLAERRRSPIGIDSRDEVRR